MTRSRRQIPSSVTSITSECERARGETTAPGAGRDGSSVGRIGEAARCDFDNIRACYPHPMRKHLLFLSFSLLPMPTLAAREASPTPAVSATPFPSATPQAVVEVTGKVFPSVVRIDVAQEVYSE